ncbi:hypothetical protein Clacol_001665 [Clathrus columnatus]|uniref:Uncharacterized protein n=1 Tax=Clathrus columnatus TaxID=1419009 RepID=A0AAV5A2L8_9AGAM|nr:hypothetical protein Clacol_001665 [Clathrus columnatus]
MPLFRHHPFRSIGYVAFSLTSSSVAILALSSLAIMIVAHHTRQGQIMTQTQEEMLLIGAFGLFWLCKRICDPYRNDEEMINDLLIFSAFLVILRAYRARDQPEQSNASVTGRSSGTRDRASIAGVGSGRRPEWPCRKDSALCIIEEWIDSPYI